MSRLSAIPRLSIVVPILRDLAAFERTLISVLENRPAGCEVIVAHDGSYDDPFDLCDEVRFVIADADHLADLVGAGATAARGRFTHILAEGACATSGWSEESLEKFEHFDAGMVVPVIRHAASGRIVAAGWRDAVDRFCKPACQGLHDVEDARPQVTGAYLQASFWRTDLLRAVTLGFSSRHSVDVACVYQRLLDQAGWRSILAGESEVLLDEETLPWDAPSASRGMRLGAISHVYAGRTATASLVRSMASSMRAASMNLLRPKYLVEAAGQLAAPLAMSAIGQRIVDVPIPRCEDQEVCVTEVRRAA